MERLELEKLLANRKVLNQLGISHRDLQRPIPKGVIDPDTYGHERGQYTAILDLNRQVYRILEEKIFGIRNETFSGLATRDNNQYNIIIKCILDAVNDKFISI